ncbi:peptide ligase PGM1-related protein [Curtobacterium flaccumfaciens]|uniref:preATP grasp domain-containing protein n=1 Tax=Curtobacterium flaccumfaciens TaxID=2035 RepID=UPI001BDF2357|nr:peptide ligase PGM1-related protein [Curtobacterium flaccumfaciens]MBT1672839.1 hypothetical protein [Curtobacterium flaccumfaciens pv. flaccumfaciens]
MSRILIGNRGASDAIGEWGKPVEGWWSQRIIWSVKDGDVVILPHAPDPDFLAYALNVLNVDRKQVRIITPDTPTVADGWLCEPALVRKVATELETVSCDLIRALNPNKEVAAFASAIGLSSAFPGARFFAQEGARFAESKSFFRAICAGVGAPIPEGAVATTPGATVTIVEDLLATTRAVILKKDFWAGGSGNLLLRTDKDIAPLGVREAIDLDEVEGAVRSTVHERWDWLTEGGRHAFVVESYLPDSAAVFAEFWIDEAVTLRATGELVAIPLADHSQLPLPPSHSRSEAQLVETGLRLATAYQRLGYRGTLSVDAIIHGSDLFLTEVNALDTGSTHVYTLAERLAGASFADDRIVLEYVGWAPGVDFEEARRRLDAAQLHYNSETRTGVSILNSQRAPDATVPYLLIARDLEEAAGIQEQLGMATQLH